MSGGIAMIYAARYPVRGAAPGRRARLLGLPSARMEEWPDRGHFVQLAEADRFAARLRAFCLR
jgi:pimeloyl-ACP methyl ester carboxylesterase